MCGKSEVLILCVKNLWPLWKYILEVRFFFYPSFRLLLPFCLKFTIHERKVELFERLLRKAACNVYFRFSYVWVGKGLHFLCIDRVCCSHLNFESFTTPSPTSRRASELEGSAYKGHRSLHRVPGGCLISSTFIQLTECGISPLWSIFIVRWTALPQMHGLHIWLCKTLNMKSYAKKEAYPTKIFPFN